MYLLISRISAFRMIDIVVQEIAPKHFEEIRFYIKYDYLEFSEKLFEVFSEPEEIHA